MILNNILFLALLSVAAIAPIEITETELRTFNVLVSSLEAGSAKKVIDETAFDLSKTNYFGSEIPMFNVTLLTDRNNTKMKEKECATFHVLAFDYDPAQIIDGKGMHPQKLIAHENKVVNELVFQQN